jgi:hypothetical protein
MFKILSVRTYLMFKILFVRTYRFPQFVPTALAQLIPNASPEGLVMMQVNYYFYFHISLLLVFVFGTFFFCFIFFVLYIQGNETLV